MKPGAIWKNKKPRDLTGGVRGVVKVKKIFEGFLLDTVYKKLAIIFADIKFQHTIFALPFAIMSAFLAAEGFPETEKLLWIFVAMVAARSSAMSFNRIVDARFDAENPRTQGRALPAGKIGAGSYVVFLVASSLIFIVSAAMLNPLAFYLSPVALGIVFFYSLTKRFTAYSHFWLGLAISVAPATDGNRR